VEVKDCLGAKVLENLGLDSSKFHQRYEQLSKPSDGKGPGKAELSEDTDKAIQCAYDQATQWGHTYIGSEHLLVGILLAGSGMGFGILTDLGITVEKVREETAKLVVPIVFRVVTIIHSKLS
jgi:ATP-dependent Clp protease ATP-binding subunit ClpC